MELFVDRLEQFAALEMVLSFSDGVSCGESLAENVVFWLVEALFDRLLDNLEVTVYNFGFFCIQRLSLFVNFVSEMVSLRSTTIFFAPSRLAATETK